MELTPEIQSTVAKGLSLLVVMLSTGSLARYFSVRVNYTRKINHFAIFFLPVFIDQQFDAETFTDFVYLAISAVITTLSLLAFYEPIRKLIPPYQLMFEGFDRPEDRPYTLAWIWTQFAAGFAVMLPMIWLFGQWGLASLVLIPILINVVGDGLAEPVGIKFGTHEYKNKQGICKDIGGKRLRIDYRFHSRGHAFRIFHYNAIHPFHALGSSPNDFDRGLLSTYLGYAFPDVHRLYVASTDNAVLVYFLNGQRSHPNVK